jgi:hypothetical protein
MSCLVLLAACGGGGGGSSSASLSFSPSKVTGNVQQGEVGTLMTSATVQNADKITDQAWVDVEDGQHVLVGIDISSIDTSHFSVTLHTSPGLSLGHHAGTFTVHVCKDQQCSQEWMGTTALAYDIDVEPAPLAAVPTTTTASTVTWKGVDSDVVGISVTGGTQFTATTGAPWLVSTGPSSGPSPAFIGFAFSVAQLAQGDYTTNITVTDSPSGQKVDIPVTLHVIPPAFVIDAGGSPVFTAINGAPIAAQPFSFELDNGAGVPWSLNSSATWLEASATSGTTPANLTLSADPSVGALASGAYDGTLTLSSGGVADKSISAHLQLIQPTLSVSVGGVTFGGDRGRDLTTPHSVQLSLNTGSNAYPVTMSAPPSWATVSSSQPVVNQSGATLTFTPVPANIPPGSTTQLMTFSSTINGDTVTYSPFLVNVNADQRRLIPSSWAVGFASTPLGTLTTRTLHVADNYGDDIPWTATSNSAWLSATPSGTTHGNALVLTADPTKVPSDVVSVAQVRVASSVANVASNDINVAIWKSATGPAAITTLPGNLGFNLVADKSRPYVYANSAGSSITVYNAYTASVVATINTLGTALGQMSVSPDGTRLYAIDVGTQTIQVLYLDSMVWGDVWPLTGTVDASTPIVAVQPDQVHVVILGNGEAYGAQGRLPSPGIVAPGHMSATDDSTRLYTIDSGISASTLSVWTLDHSDIAGGVLYATRTASILTDQAYGVDIAVSGDGSVLASAAAVPYSCTALNPATLAATGTLPGAAGHPNNVEVTWDNRLICGVDGVYATDDFWVYTAAGAVKSAYKVAGYARSTLLHSMVVTPDGMIVVVPTNDPQLSFVPIGP